MNYNNKINEITITKINDCYVEIPLDFYFDNRISAYINGDGVRGGIAVVDCIFKQANLFNVIADSVAKLIDSSSVKINIFQYNSDEFGVRYGVVVSPK